MSLQTRLCNKSDHNVVSKTSLKKLFNSFTGLIPIFVFIAVWEIVAKIADNQLYPPFSDVVREFYNLLFVNGILWTNFLASFTRVIIGLVSGSTIGLLTGIALGRNRVLERIFSPILSIIYPIPALGWLPLLMLWVGINEMLPILIVFICSFFPIMYNTITGVKNVDQSYIKAAKTVGATEKEILWKIILPLAVPNIFTGLKLEAGMAWRVIIAAEMVAIPTGIGVLLMKAESLIRVDILIVCLMVLSLMCFLFEKTIKVIEDKITCHWR
ncbi:MAG: ABC transporter permease [Eubacteriales bacterium]